MRWTENADRTNERVWIDRNLRVSVKTWDMHGLPSCVADGYVSQLIINNIRLSGDEMTELEGIIKKTIAKLANGARKIADVSDAVENDVVEFIRAEMGFIAETEIGLDWDGKGMWLGNDDEDGEITVENDLLRVTMPAKLAKSTKTILANIERAARRKLMNDYLRKSENCPAQLSENLISRLDDIRLVLEPAMPAEREYVIAARKYADNEIELRSAAAVDALRAVTARDRTVEFIPAPLAPTQGM